MPETQEHQTIELTKNHLAVANAASKDDARPVLQAVHVEEGRIVASDGYIMVAAEIEAPEGMVPFNVPAVTFKKAPKTTRRLPKVVLDATGRIADHQGSTISNGLVEGTFPDADFFTLLKGEVKARVAIGVPILKSLLASIGDASIIYLYINTESSPIHFETDTGEGHHGSIMPVFVQWGNKKVHAAKGESAKDGGEAESNEEPD